MGLIYPSSYLNSLEPFRPVVWAITSACSPVVDLIRGMPSRFRYKLRTCDLAFRRADAFENTFSTSRVR